MNLCLIQRDGCIRQYSQYKNPQFLHLFPPAFMPNPNVGLGAAKAATSLYQVQDVFKTYCPQWSDLGIDMADLSKYLAKPIGVPSCVEISAGPPPLYRISDMFIRCPPQAELCSCVSGCTNPPTCNSTNCKSTAWAAHGSGYEVRDYKHCSDSWTCASETQYRCADGYWGTPSNGASGCSPCPNPGTSPAGTTEQTGCYVMSGTDAAGIFSYADKCYYQ